MIRKILERVSRERVLRRRLPERFSRTAIYVTPDSALSYWKRDLGRLGAELFDFAESFVRQGDVVWDIGANVGLFAFAAAELTGESGRVTALEPDLFLASLLRKSARVAYEPGRVEVLPLAISDEVDVLDFDIAERGRSSSHLASASGNSQTGGVRERVQVGAVTLDWLLERRPVPAVVKIDVEGAERRVLHGARALLETGRPTLLCEVGEESADAVTDLFAELGYVLFDWAQRLEAPVERATYSTLAVPRERAPGR